MISNTNFFRHLPKICLIILKVYNLVFGTFVCDHRVITEWKLLLCVSLSSHSAYPSLLGACRTFYKYHLHRIDCSPIYLTSNKGLVAPQYSRVSKKVQPSDIAIFSDNAQYLCFDCKNHNLKHFYLLGNFCYSVLCQCSVCKLFQQKFWL